MFEPTMKDRRTPRTLLITLIFFGVTITAVQAQSQPDPVELMKAVAHDRNQIKSGSMEMEVTSRNNSDDAKNDHLVRLKIVFEGGKRRFESNQREYGYIFIGEIGAEVLEQKMTELGVDREAAVDIGLMDGWDAHRKIIHLGDTIYTHQSDRRGQPGTIAMRSSERSSSQHLFDPRVLGLATFLWQGQTVESTLQYTNSKSFSLIGEDIVNDHAVWHVKYSNTTSKFPYTFDFWISKDKPHRVHKQFHNGETAWSTYNEDDASDPLPVKVVAGKFDGDVPAGRISTFRRFNTAYNIDVPSNTWTIAGLRPPIGAEVSDERLHRRIGYWDGTGVSEKYPANAPRRVSFPGLSRAKVLALALKDPESAFAREAAINIVAFPNDEPSIGPATELLIEHHLADPRMSELARILIHNGRQKNVELLRLILAASPDPAVQGVACYALGCVLKYQGGQNAETKAEVRQLFDRVINDYVDFELEGKPLSAHATFDRDR